MARRTKNERGITPRHFHCCSSIRVLCERGVPDIRCGGDAAGAAAAGMIGFGKVDEDAYGEPLVSIGERLRALNLRKEWDAGLRVDLRRLLPEYCLSSIFQ